MRSPFTGLVILLVGGAALATLGVGAGPLNAAPVHFLVPGPQQQMSASVCTSYKPPKGAGKFTGRIQALTGGTSFDVTSGNETAVVTYSNSTTFCQGGQPASAEALRPGLNVVAYGETNRVGKTYRVAATMIVVEGSAASAPRMTSNSAPSNDPGSNSNSMQNPVTPPQNNSDSFGRSQTTSGAGPLGQQNRGGSGISCESMTFNVPGAGSIGPGMGRPGGRTQVDGITCVMPVNQESLQLIDDAITGKRMASAILTWQNVISVTLTNAFVSSVQFTADGSQPVARVTFLFTKMDLQGPGGTRITLEGKP